ncbi:MAG: phosphoglycerate dehydrogenase [Verrucomicrobia bacterium]|nr:phosphoglycerate dehydrogenase [Verrucomicrobiota bacterium]
MSAPLIKVTSPSFSSNRVLVQELAALPFRLALNEQGCRLHGSALAEYLADADGAVIGLERIDAALIQACPRLKVIAKYGVGLDNVDQDACRRRGVEVGWTPGVNRRSVAEMTVGLMIGLSRNLFATSQKLRNGLWEKNGGRQLSNLRIGLIGLGNVGQELVRLLKPFDCPILGNDIADREEFCREEGVIVSAKDEIFASADIVSLHVPLTEETRYLVNPRTLNLMKPDAFLINTSRGAVVDQEALKLSLRANRIAGAAIDVYEQEPPTDREFLELPNLVCTPHIAGNAWEAVVAMGRSAIQHLQACFIGASKANVIAPSEFQRMRLRRTA